MKELEAEDTDEAKARIENIDELISKAASYEDEAEDPSLSGFLEEVALIADIDSVEESDNRVLLMTLHSAKGLEFPNNSIYYFHACGIRHSANTIFYAVRSI